MDLKITTNKKNEVLKRSEIVSEFDQKTIPSREEIRKNIAAQLNTDTKLIVVNKVDVGYGSNKGSANVRVYDNYADLKNVEAKFVVERNKEKEAPKEENAEGAEAVEEKREADEKKEDAPAEEKKEEVKKNTDDKKIVEEEAKDIAEQAIEEKKEEKKE